MNNGYVEYGARVICTFISVNNYAVLHGVTNKLYCKFEVAKLWPPEDYKWYSALNCYGLVKINEVEIRRLICPSFFKLASNVPEFCIELTEKEISLIEEIRGDRDINISFNLKILCSFDKDSFFELNNLCELDFNLHTSIPKSKWIEEFLQKWQFFNSNERIIFLNNINQKFKVREIITKAKSNFYTSDFEGTLVSCYKALEAIPKEFNFKDIKAMFQELTTKGSQAKKYKHLNELFKSVKNFMHIARHLEDLEDSEFQDIPVTKSDARLALIYTELPIDYLIENMS